MIARTPAHRRHLGRHCWLLVAALVVGAPLQAQGVLGAGPDAVTIPRGMLRIGLSGEHTLQRDRWNDGRLEALGAGFSGDSLGPSALSVIGPLRQLMRDVGVPDLSASLGTSRLDLRQRIFVTPLSIEYGVTDWLTLGVRAPLVRSKAEASVRIRGDSGRATIGLNPYFLGSAVPAANRSTIDRYAAAAAGLSARRAACQSNAGAAPECPTILAELTSVNALIARGTQFANGLAGIYGAPGLAAGQPFVPMAGSAIELALRARVDSLRTAFTRYGITEIAPTTGLPLGAQAPLGAADLAALVADSLNGFGARPMTGTAITGFGDLEFGATLKLFDSFGRASDSRFAASRFGIRQAIGIDMRLGTGTRETPDDFIDHGTGTGRNAITVRSMTDIVWSSRFWTTVSVAMTQAAGSTERLRVPDPGGTEYQESWREADVPVHPGRALDLSLTPRWQLNEYLALGASWRRRSQSAGRHDIDSIVVAPAGFNVALLGTALDARTASDVQQLGWHVSYSTIAARAAGTDGLAFEISFSHEQAISSSTGIVPKTWLDRVQIRYYTRLFGR